MELLEQHPEIENVIKMQYNALNATTFNEKWQNRLKIDLMIGDIYCAYKYDYSDLGSTLFEHYFQYLIDRYETEPLISLFGFINLAEMLNYVEKCDIPNGYESLSQSRQVAPQPGLYPPSNYPSCYPG